MSIARLRDFVRGLTVLADEKASEQRFLTDGKALLERLVRQDDWLPAEFAEPGPTYQQNLLHCDPRERFSVVCFVWGPGQQTPVHNHTVWGLVGMLRGEEVSTQMIPDAAGGPMREGEVDRLRPGEVIAVSPNLYDIHRVRNAYDDRASISIHAYGANIGSIRRSVFDPATSAATDFVSGYTTGVMPNLWDRKAAA